MIIREEAEKYAKDQWPFGVPDTADMESSKDDFLAGSQCEAVQALVRALEHVRDCWSSDLETLPKYAESELQKWASRSMAKGE